MVPSALGHDLSPPRPARHDCDVLVVGVGPSGAATAYWLARAGHDVLLVEKKQLPREKTCGDGLTPRSVRQLEEMGLGDELARCHRFDGLRAIAFGRELSLPWPEHPEYGRRGDVVTRHTLDELVAHQAEKAGVTLWQGAEAVTPLDTGASPLGLLPGVTSRAAGGAVVVDRVRETTTEVRARYVVVADGANSRFGRSLGTSRDRSVPLGLAIRGYYASPRHAEPWIESHLDLRDRNGNVVPGYGWIFPLGDGRVNVGIGVVSSAGDRREVNTTELLASFVEHAPGSWQLGPSSACGAPTGGKLPMGLSVGPRSGPGYLVVGDAGGAINPFNGEGIAYGYETGRLAARSISAALSSGDARALAGYEAELDATYGLYYKVGSIFMALMGRPELLRILVSTGMRSRTIMEWLLRIMANLLRPDELGPAEAAYRAAAVLVRRTRLIIRRNR